MAVIRYYQLIRLFLLIGFVLCLFLAFFFIWVTLPLAAIALLYLGFGVSESREHVPAVIVGERKERHLRLAREAEARRKVIAEERARSDSFNRL